MKSGFHVAVACVSLVVACQCKTLAQNAAPSTFKEYALSSQLSPDETYTLEMLIDRVQFEFDPKYWEEDAEREKARQAPNYKPQVLKQHVEPAEAELKKLNALSFQRINKADRPVRSLTAVKYLPALEWVALVDNEIADLGPLAACKNLKHLHLVNNPPIDLSPLAKCTSLQELHLAKTVVADLAALEALPNLRELSLSHDQIPAFKRLKRLPALRSLELDLDMFDSFAGLPEMPELRAITKAEVRRLDGLERYSKLENLVNLSGRFPSFEPLRNLKGLTHINVLGSRVTSLEPLSGLTQLRDFHLTTNTAKIDLAPLESLPALHAVDVKCFGKEPAELEKLRASLSSWDTEFLARRPRYTPSMRLEVVDQEKFDYYDGEPYNKDPNTTNEQMLSSELEWLDERLEKVLAGQFKQDDDYTIPFNWPGARSRTIVLYSDQAVSAFPKLVLAMQKVLAEAKEDWIIYFQTDGPATEFIVWVYPDKIVTTEEHADAVRKLIK